MLSESTSSSISSSELGESAAAGAASELGMLDILIETHSDHENEGQEQFAAGLKLFHGGDAKPRRAKQRVELATSSSRLLICEEASMGEPNQRTFCDIAECE